ncbi:MAG: DAK2 domain-containing protein, partial [Gammaproteobacteria bacterium]
KADTGEKTMLDVLVPVAELLKEESGDLKAILDRVVATAEGGVEATRDMQATKGRASFLGERSIGHLDPGAMSSCLMIKTVCACAKEQL